MQYRHRDTGDLIDIIKCIPGTSNTDYLIFSEDEGLEMITEFRLNYLYEEKL
jgi:hypothetical protein